MVSRCSPPTTAYNVVGVAVLLPLIERFTRVVERILPERASPLTRCLDRAALATPLAAEEAVRRTVSRALAATGESIGDALTAGKPPVAGAPAGQALREARVFVSEASGPPESEEEQARPGGPAPGAHALAELERCASALRDLQPVYREAMLTSVASGAVSADEALSRVDTVRRLEKLAHFAWRSAAHLVGGRLASRVAGRSGAARHARPDPALTPPPRVPAAPADTTPAPRGTRSTADSTR